MVPELGLRFCHQPRDVIFIKEQMVRHFIMKWEPNGANGDGDRFSFYASKPFSL